MDWLDLLAVQGTLKSPLQHHSSKASILRRSAFFMVQLSHPYMTNGKTIALTRQTCVGKVLSLLFNMLSGLVVTSLPRSKASFNFMVTVIICSDFGAPQNKVCHCFQCFSTYLPWSDGTRCHGFSFLNVEFYVNFFTLLFHFHQEASWELVMGSPGVLQFMWSQRVRQDWVTDLNINFTNLVRRRKN